MRIISGNFKGKKIFIPSDNNTRPLRDMVKESIFNLLQHSNKINLDIKDSNILDLFSGTGSFGLECISRGSKSVIFMENYDKILKILRKNIEKLGINANCRIIKNDCFKFFNTKKDFKDKFDIIFMDPPFREKKINIILEKIKENKILAKNGILLIHRHKKDDVKITNKIQIIDQRIYGISKIVIAS